MVSIAERMSKGVQEYHSGAETVALRAGTGGGILRESGKRP